MTHKILGLFVLFALFVNLFGASADTLSDYQKKYDHLASKYKYINSNYAAAISKYDAVKNSGDIFEMQKMIASLQGVESTSQSTAHLSDQYAQELVKLGGTQEAQLAKDFKWLSVALQNLNEKAAKDRIELERAIEKQQTKTELEVQLSLLNKLVLKEQEEKASFSVLATMYHVKTMEKALQDMQQLQQLNFDILDYITLAIDNENKAYAASETELENAFIELKYKLYADQNDLKSDEAKLKEFITVKAAEEISQVKAELELGQKTVATLESDVDKAQCAQDKQSIFKAMSALNALVEKDIAEKKAFLSGRANGLTEFSLPEAELYFEQAKKYDVFADKVTAVLNKPFNAAACQATGNPPPQPPVPGTNKVPVFTKVGSQDVKPNTPILFGVKPSEKIEFVVVATDEDKDVLTYSVESSPVGSTFAAATQTFSWTPTNTQMGSYTFAFKTTDAKGGDAKVSLTITVSATGQPVPPPVPPAQQSAQEQAFKELKNKFDAHEEDFNEYEDKYNKAVKKQDTSDVNKYKKQLKKLDDDLKELDNKLDTLLLEVEKMSGMSSLESDIEDKIDDIKSLRQDIKDVLGGKQKKSEAQLLSANQVSGTTAKQPVVQEKDVVVEKLAFLPGTPPGGVSTVAGEQAEEQTTSMGMMAVLVGGVVVLIAVIVFLLALLVA